MKHLTRIALAPRGLFNKSIAMYLEPQGLSQVPREHELDRDAVTVALGDLRIRVCSMQALLDDETSGEPTVRYR